MKKVVILNGVCSAAWLLCSISNFMHGDKRLAVIQFIVCLLWVFITVKSSKSKE